MAVRRCGCAILRLKTAVVRWYLYALRRRVRLLRSRWLGTPNHEETRLSPEQIDGAVAEGLGRAAGLPYLDGLAVSEFRVSSQNGEDGLLARVFAEVGTKHRTFVEFGIDDGRQCNCACLAIHKGWTGLMLDMDAAGVRRAREHFRFAAGGPSVRVEEAFLTAENIDDSIRRGGVRGEIDLLSIDVDGNDYWLWEAVQVVDPRVVIIEYNASFGMRSLTVPYDPNFRRWRKHVSGWYHGASLHALENLGKHLGYDLVATESAGVNAVFLRQDVPKGGLRTMTSEEAYRPQAKRCAVATVEEQFDAISHLEMVEIHAVGS